MWIRLFLLVTLALTLSPIFSTQVLAQEEPAQPVVVSEEVDVEGEAPEIPPLSGIDARLPMDAVDLPASFSSVGHPLLTDQTALVLSDALANIAGVNVQTGSANFDIFYLRGFDSLAGGLVLTDGAIEPESTFQHLYNVDKVEVLRGASGGFLYGGRALAGTVNLVRKVPVQDNFTQWGVVGGSHGYWQATLDTNWRISDTAGFRLNGMWHTAENFREDNESDAWAINPVFSWQLDRTDITLSLEQVRNEFEPDGGLPIVGGRLANVDRERSYDDASDFFEQDVTRIQLNLRHEISDRLEFRGKLYYTDLDWQSAGTILAGAVDLGFLTLVARTQSDLDDQQTFYGLQAELASSFETGSVTHEFLVGVEAGRQDDDFRLGVSLLAPVDLVTEALLGNPTPVPIPSQTRFGDVSSDVLGLYAFDRISFSDRFQVVLGGRFDQIDFSGDGTAADRDDDQFSPLAGLVVKPRENVSLYASYSESFEPQSTLVVGEVIPEEGQQVEVGAKFDLGSASLNLAWYRLEKENIAIVDQTGFPSQTGDQESEGLELEIVAELARGLDLRFGYAYTDAELTEFRELVVFGAGPFDFAILDRSGNAPGWVPEHMANLWITQRFDSGFGFGFGGRYLDEQFIAPDNSFAVDSSVVLDAALFYTFNDLQLNLNILNVTDEDYETRAFGPFAVSPATGTEVRAGIRYLM